MDTIDPTQYGAVIDATAKPGIITVPIDFPPSPHDIRSLERLYINGREFGFVVHKYPDWWEISTGSHYEAANVAVVADTRANVIDGLREWLRDLSPVYADTPIDAPSPS